MYVGACYTLYEMLRYYVFGLTLRVCISLESMEQHDTGRVTLELLFMGRNKTITASRLVLFCRTRFITRTTLLEMRILTRSCVFLSLRMTPATPQEPPLRPCVVASKSSGTLLCRPVRRKNVEQYASCIADPLIYLLTYLLHGAESFLSS